MSAVLLEKDVALSDRIRQLRRAKGLSQEQLAYRAGVTVGVIRKLEQGAVKDPNWSTMLAIAGQLGASLDDLAAAAESPKEEKPPPGRPKKSQTQPPSVTRKRA